MTRPSEYFRLWVLAKNIRIPLEPRRFAFPGLNINVRTLHLHLGDFAEIQLPTPEKFCAEFPKFLASFTKLKRLSVEYYTLEPRDTNTIRRIVYLDHYLRRSSKRTCHIMVKCTSFIVPGIGKKYAVKWIWIAEEGILMDLSEVLPLHLHVQAARRRRTITAKSITSQNI